MHCTNCGNQIPDKAKFCPQCGKKTIINKISNKKRNKKDLTDVKIENTSGQGSGVAIPDELKKWNWGAFFLGWIWGLGNNTFISLLTLIPGLNFIVCFFLGARGNEWAWQNKRWENIKHFKRVQREWAKWSWGILIVCSLVLCIFLSLIYGGIILISIVRFVGFVVL